MEDVKQCPQCLRTLDRLTGFHRRVASSDNSQTYCRECQRARVDAYQSSHAGYRDQQNEYSRRYATTYPDRVKATKHNHYMRNRERLLLAAKQRLADPARRQRKTETARRWRERQRIKAVNALSRLSTESPSP